MFGLGSTRDRNLLLQNDIFFQKICRTKLIQLVLFMGRASVFFQSGSILEWVDFKNLTSMTNERTEFMVKFFSRNFYFSRHCDKNFQTGIFHEFFTISYRTELVELSVWPKILLIRSFGKVTFFWLCGDSNICATNS